MAWPAAVCECDKITALVMERGRKAFEAIIDNQNSMKPREGEEIESNGEGGEGESWSGTVYRKLECFLLKGKKRKHGGVTDLKSCVQVVWHAITIVCTIPLSAWGKCHFIHKCDKTPTNLYSMGSFITGPN